MKSCATSPQKIKDQLTIAACIAKRNAKNAKKVMDNSILGGPTCNGAASVINTPRSKVHIFKALVSNSY